MKTMLSIITTALVALMATGCAEDALNDAEELNPDATVTLSRETANFDYQGGSLSFTVQSSREWSAYSDDSWIKVTYTPGTSTSGSVDVEVAANSTTAEREGSVVVKSGSTRKSLTITQSGKVVAGITCPLSGYNLVWNDEFETNGSLDRGSWSYQVADAGWVNSEKQIYVDETTPAGTKVAEVKNGELNITCLKESGKIYSARVYANKTTGWKYGYFEANICLPSGKGTWPAYWMMPVNYKNWPNDGEIDIMEEVGYNPNVVVSTIHCIKYNNSGTAIESASRKLADAEGAFHKYGLEWTADYMTFYVDDEKLLTYKNDGTGTNAWPFDAPFYVILNLAFGGSWGGAQGIDESCLPATMKVDYVRVWQK